MSRLPRPLVLALGALTLALMCAPADAQQAGGARPGGRRPFGGGGFGMMGGGLNLTMVATNAQAQEKAGLTDAEKEAVGKLAEEARAARRGTRQGGRRNFQDMTQEEIAKAMEEMRAARVKADQEFLAKLKTAVGDEKCKKLVQIAAGVALRPAGPSALRNKELSDAVGVSAESQAKVVKIVEASTEKMRGAFQPGGDRGAMQARIAEVRAAINKEIGEVLTDKEKEAVKAAVAAAEGVEIMGGRRGGGRRGGGGPGGGQ
jgi:Spy/CpxP family protein refolding chaperone